MTDAKEAGTSCRDDDKDGDTAQKQAIADHLAQEIYKYLEAMNNRNHDINSPMWASLDPTFTFDGWIADRVPGSGTVHYFAMLDRIAEANPKYQIKILDISTVVHERKSKAEVFVNTETSDMPIGVIRQAVTILTWKLKAGKWFCTARKTFPGNDGVNSQRMG